jgi:chromosome partitioning protein
VACDTILIPVQTEFFALEGMTMLLELVEMISKELGHSMKRRYLLTMYDARTNLSKDVARKVKEHFQEEVFKTVIPQNIKLAEAPSYGKSIYSLAPESPGAEAYAQLAKEMIE